MRSFDIVVIGAGSGGLSVAYTAKGFGKSVALIDKNKPGGECTWGGCVPSKALINIANDISIARKYADIKVDTKEILDKVREIIHKVYEGESVDVLKRDGIEYINGFARFKDKNTLIVNDEEIRADKIFISTGSSPMIPNIEGLDSISYLTNETIFYEERLPESIIVLGGGAIGVELSQAMAKIGVRVHLIEIMSSILNREEPELISMLEDNIRQIGVSLHTSSKALRIEEKNNKVYLHASKNGKEEIIVSDKILIALGRVPNIKGLDLDSVGIRYNTKGIEVNEHLETNVKGIYAVGDVVGPYLFSHMANVQAITAVQNAILPINKKIDYSNIAWCTFSDPELARAGLIESEARKKYGDSIRVYTYNYNDLDRAKFKENSKGMVKIMCNRKGYVLGASILGDRAGELISEIQVIKTLRVNLGKISKVIHPYPAYSEVLLKISKKVYVDNILNNRIVKFFKK